MYAYTYLFFELLDYHDTFHTFQHAYLTIIRSILLNFMNAPCIKIFMQRISAPFHFLRPPTYDFKRKCPICNDLPGYMHNIIYVRIS